MIKAYSSTVIAVPVGQVWERVRDFNGLPSWHPAATDSKIEEGHANGEVGCVRNFALTDGSGRIRETLLAISDLEHTLSYDMLPNGPLPFVNYIAKMKFTPITDRNETFAEWWADFEAGDGQTQHWHDFVAIDVFIGGFRALEDSFKR
ncbi:SRPBCC family protein [Shimia sp. R9_3]|uniref:SRPBCC family protein n=1 Tax=Shimia sp. R9_3 TaxID=2821113 RepID=UPI001ADC1FF9|nr:SRPBCC family protein [Shimia sp. R9_3]MBO9402908.1 SRPBCC family protein [Shimia sp. R9_3]